jgi:uncharacterized protein (DUF305 family)
MKTSLPLATAAAVLLLAAGAAFGQGMRGPSTPRLEPHLAGQPPAVKGETQSTTDYKAATERTTDAAQDVTYTGNADRDFVAGLMPHQQGIADIAKVELQYGKDPEMRKLAQSILDAQAKQMALMEQWQAQHPPKP